MKLSMYHGLAIGLLAGLITIGNAQAQSIGWPTPNTPCTEANAGETYDVQHYTRREQLQITYYCDGDSWQLFQVCDLRPGGLCVAY
jgi:hypothetical protein